jgi:hypothetical protein
MDFKFRRSQMSRDPMLCFIDLVDSACSPPGPGSLLSVSEPEMALHCTQPLTSWASVFVAEDHDLTASSNAPPVDCGDNTVGDGNPVGAGQEESFDAGPIQHGASPTVGSPCDQPLLEATVAAQDQAQATVLDMSSPPVAGSPTA